MPIVAATMISSFRAPEPGRLDPLAAMFVLFIVGPGLILAARLA
jgi:hypothetical protein